MDAEFLAEIKRLYQDENLKVAEVAERLGITKTKCQNTIKYYHLTKKTYHKTHYESPKNPEPTDEEIKKLVHAKEKQAHKVTVNGKKWIDLTEFYT